MTLLHEPGRLIVVSFSLHQSGGLLVPSYLQTYGFGIKKYQDKKDAQVGTNDERLIICVAAVS